MIKIIKVDDSIIFTNANIDENYPKILEKESKDTNIIKHAQDSHVIIDKGYIYLPGERSWGFYNIYKIDTIPTYCNMCGQKVMIEKEKHVFHCGFNSQTGKKIYGSFLQINCCCPEEVIVNGEERYQFVHHRMFRKLEEEKKWWEYTWEQCNGID